MVKEQIGWRGEKCPYCGTYGTHNVYREFNQKGVLIVYVECTICGERFPLRGEL